MDERCAHLYRLAIGVVMVVPMMVAVVMVVSHLDDDLSLGGDVEGEEDEECG